MKKSKIGHYYENFKYGRVFHVEDEDLVSLKAYKTWKGQHNKIESWVCLSWKSGKPIIYRYTSRLGIQNITYRKLSEEINWLLGKVSNGKDKVKQNRVKRKFVSLCNKFFKSRQDVNSINANCLRAWMPLLEQYKDDCVLDFVPILDQSLVREGLKRDSLKQATEAWFGRSPKGLVRRIATILDQTKLSQLVLGLSCRDWNLDHLYVLLDSNIKWDTTLEIKKASFLLKAYGEKRWLKLLQPYRGSRIHSYELYDAIEMFDELRIFDYSLPIRPRSIRALHQDLTNELERRKAEQLKDIVLPQKFLSLEGLEVGKFQFAIPRIGNDLILWGRQLNNCLVSYVKKVLDGKYSVIGVLEENKIKYALGIRDRHIEQFYGVSNSLPLVEHDQLIRGILKTYRVS